MGFERYLTTFFRSKNSLYRLLIYGTEIKTKAKSIMQTLVFVEFV